MRKILLSLIAVFLLCELTIANYAMANPVVGMKPVYAKVLIESPQNTNYNGSDIQLSFTVLTNAFTKGFSNYSDNHCFITLDSKRYEFYGLSLNSQATISNDGNYNPYTELTVVGNTSISNLATGSHSIKIEYDFYYSYPDRNYQIEYIVLNTTTVTLQVDSNISPDTQATILLPTPHPYPTVSIPPMPTLKPSVHPSPPHLSPSIEPTITQPVPNLQSYLDSTQLLLFAIGVVTVLIAVISSLLYLRHRKTEIKLSSVPALEQLARHLFHG